MRVINGDSAWNGKIESYLEQEKSSTFYHHPEYLEILSEESNQVGIKLICLDEKDNIIGLLPLLTTKGLPFKLGGLRASKRLASLPRTTVCGPIGLNEEVIKFLLKRAIKKAQENKRPVLQLKSFEALSKYNENFVSIPLVTTYIKEIKGKNHTISFYSQATEKEILRSVRKAEKLGVKYYKASDITDLKNWYILYLHNVRRHGLVARSFTFFEKLWNNFYPKDMINLDMTIKQNGKNKEIYAGTLNFKYKDTVYGVYKGSLKKSLPIFTDDFLHYHQLINYQQEGIKYLDMGEVQKNQSGLARYKLKWGTLEKTIFHSYYLYKKNINFEVLNYDHRNKIKINLLRKVPLSGIEILGKKINSYL
jgi:hypothetical protein